MSKDTTITAVLRIASSNIIKLTSSILIAFLLPKLLGVEDFGYYKIFLLYATYMGIFHFGFADGIYLEYGGLNYSELDLNRFRIYTRFFIKIQTMLSLIGVTIVLLLVKNEYLILLIMLFIYIPIINLINYFQLISQAVSRFKEYSNRILLLSLLNIVIIAIMILMNISNYKVYILFLIIINFIILIGYFYTYRNIIVKPDHPILIKKREYFNLFKIGIPLLLANLTSTLVLTVDRQIVEIFFDLVDFSVYSFAYSMLAIITTLVSAVSIVIYPILKNVDKSNIQTTYSKLIQLIVIFVMFSLTAYFPLKWIIPKFLPEYSESLTIFMIALPGLMISSSITAIKHNFFKVLNKNNHYFYIAILSIIISIILNLIFYYVFLTKEAIAVSSVISLFVWYIITELYMIKFYKVKWKKNILLIIFSGGLFYGLSNLQNYIIFGFIYFTVVSLIIVFNYRSKIKRGYRSLLKKRNWCDKYEK
ncbi:integral membrane protein [Acholeplasma laidlawii]|uniref:Integral membrane protein n=1 Tax=Acholeplasma laidlawii (strain PG-8A) TaxID=441768 RepID=A9NH18_ACHLI|nr:integral membrane protein [Acholeplasma laidlawii]ABX81648.1 integral membrane protein [Acholeplasma laidlawii PG-8A]NWH09776.1 hypothetical protein [Acholeplasma laidlawii]NWH11166.1 hypothetical protein [Acholeplasma laidlawii]NWH14028.1 hypothetical protein [Acholeplasma laidlawii]OAN20432.1 hypothetical protein A2I99_01915 [Acholeplasma laidlawii]